MIASILLGIITLVIAAISYSFYIRDTLKGKTKPHAFTWGIWGVLNIFIFYGQVDGGGGPGAWVTAATAMANILIFLLAFKYGKTNITKLDVACAIIAVTALCLWCFSGDIAISVILSCVVFILGLIPTIVKSIRSAHEETAVTFALNASKFLIALFALQTISLETALYPAVLFIVNGCFAGYLFYSQRQGKQINNRKA